jgi:hypothetical protein
MHTTRNRILMLTAVVFLSSAYAWAISEGGAIFLMIRPGARPSGMGSAFCAIADDATATYYNPAGLAFLKRNDPQLVLKDIKDWGRFMNSFKDAPEAATFTWEDLNDPEGMIIQLSGTPLLSIPEVKDWDKLMILLADTLNQPGKKILPRLNEDARSIIAGHQPGEVLDSQAKAILIYALNGRINNLDTYKNAGWENAEAPMPAAGVLSRYRLYPDSLGFIPANVKDPQALAQRIKTQADPVSQYIYSRMPARSKTLISRKYQDRQSDSLKTALAAVLNQVCRQSDFYQAQRFAKVTLRPGTIPLAGTKPTGGALSSFNQNLLLQCYSGLLSIQTAELAQEDLRLLNRQALDSFLPGALAPYGASAPIDTLTAYLKEKAGETISQILLQYTGEAPLAEGEKRLWLDALNKDLLADSQLVGKPAPSNRPASPYLSNLVKLGVQGNLGAINKSLLAEYYPEWFNAVKKDASPYQYLKSLLSPEALAELNSHFKGQGVSSEGRQVILASLNQIISRKDFYQKDLWTNIPVAPEAQELLAEGPDNLSTSDLKKLNRTLLEGLYPAEMEKIGRDKSYASLMHSPWLSDIWADVGDMYYEYIAYVQPYKDWGVFGISTVFISEGTSMRTNTVGEDQGEFSSYEFSPCLSYGNELFKGLAGGVNLKLIHSHLAPFGAEGSQGKGVATTWALDFGLLYRGPVKGLSFGANLQNIGPRLVYIDAEQSDPLSRNIRAGTAYKILDGRWARLTAAYDVTKMLVVYDRPWREELKEAVQHMGLEYQYNGPATLGIRTGYVLDEVGKIKGATYGFGVGYKNIQFDFGMEPGGELQTYNKKFSLSVEL